MRLAIFPLDRSRISSSQLGILAGASHAGTNTNCRFPRTQEAEIKKAKLLSAWQRGCWSADGSQLGGPFRRVAILEYMHAPREMQGKKLGIRAGSGPRVGAQLPRP